MSIHNMQGQLTRERTGLMPLTSLATVSVQCGRPNEPGPQRLGRGTQDGIRGCVSRAGILLGQALRATSLESSLE